MAEIAMPDLGWLHEATEAKPGTYGWVVCEAYEDDVFGSEPGSLEVRLVEYGMFSRRGWCLPRTWKSKWVNAETIADLTPEQQAEGCVRLAGEILDEVRRSLPKLNRADVNGLTGAVISPRIKRSGVAVDA